MENLEYILDFVLEFAEHFLHSGANLERVNDTVYRICDSYGCRDVHFFSISCYMTLSLKDAQGNRVCGQRCIRGETDTNLELLHHLNALSRKICSHHPQPKELSELLAKTLQVEGYPLWQVALGRLLAMTCIGVMNGGTISDLVIVWLNTVLLFLAGQYVKKPGLNKTVYNIFCTFVTGSIAIFFTRIGFVDDFYVVIIVNSMMLIPGIASVNAFRNILCGNEINGILEFFKAVLETVAIVGGFILCIFLFGGSVL